MAKYLELEIDNSAASAIKTGKWNAPGAAFYDQLLNSFHYGGKIPEDAEELNKCIREGKYRTWVQYLEEAYLIAPVKKIHNSPHGVTPFSRSGCKYPHHVIKGNKLVLSVPGIKAAYARALQMGVLKGDVKKHLERHIHELGLEVSFKSGALSWNEACEVQIESNFHDIYATIMEHTGINLFESEEYFGEASHGTKKVHAFRAVVDSKTKHILKVVYMIDGMKPGPANKHPIEKIHKYGNTDFQSYGGKVVDIVDTETNEHLPEADVYGVFGYKTTAGGYTLYHIKVGEVETEPTYKSTYWPRSGTPYANYMKTNGIRDMIQNMEKKVYYRNAWDIHGVQTPSVDYGILTTPEIRGTPKHPGRDPEEVRLAKAVQDAQLKMNLSKRTKAEQYAAAKQEFLAAQEELRQYRISIGKIEQPKPEQVPEPNKPMEIQKPVVPEKPRRDPTIEKQLEELCRDLHNAMFKKDRLLRKYQEMDKHERKSKSADMDKRSKEYDVEIEDLHHQISKLYNDHKDILAGTDAADHAEFELHNYNQVKSSSNEPSAPKKHHGPIHYLKKRAKKLKNSFGESVIEGSDDNPVLTSDFNDEVGEATAEALWNWMHNNIQYDKSLGDWKLRTAAELYIDKKGNCHDQAYFAAFILNSWGYDARLLFFMEFDDDSEIGGNTHTLCYFRKREPDAMWYWFENAWEDQAGIHGPFENVEEVKQAVMKTYEEDNDINSHKFDGIVFGSVSNYRLGMNLHDYVDSWTLDDDRRFADMNKDPIQEAMELLDWITEAATNKDHQETMSDVLKKCKTPQELLNWMDCIEYGWIDKAGNKNGTGESDDTSKMWAEYKLQSPLQLIRSKTGVCWDQCELERVWFQRYKYPFTIVYLEIDDDEAKPSHTFLVYKEPGESSEVYWFEHSWGQKKGIHKFSDFGTCMQTVIQQFEISQGKKHGQNPVYKHMIIPAPKFGINVIKYMEYARKCREIDLGDIQYDDIFGESVLLTEASHGKLKVDHRLCVDVKTGHRLHVIYSLDGIILTQNNVVDSGDKLYHTKNRTKDDKEVTKTREVSPGVSYRSAKDGSLSEDEVKKLKRYGNTDHESYNQKVLAIIDMDTGAHLDQAVTRGPFGSNTYNKENEHKIVVGEIDMVPCFKSTFWAKGGRANNTATNISNREISARIRGVNGDPNRARSLSYTASNYDATDRNGIEGNTARKVEILKMHNKLLSALAPYIKPMEDLQSALGSSSVTAESLMARRKDFEKKLNFSIDENWGAEVLMPKDVRDGFLIDSNRVNSMLDAIHSTLEYIDPKDPEYKVDRDTIIAGIKQFMRIYNNHAKVIGDHTHKSYVKEIDGPIHYIKKGMKKLKKSLGESVMMEDGEPPAMENPTAASTAGENPQQEESKPKKVDRVESPKNGVRRKKLYIAFIEWCKEYNDKNAFGSIFDEDAFKVSYPFVPEEMRYFYRLANPMLCVLSGDMTFFPVAELRKLNAQNSDISNQLIFAATPNDVRVFNCRDKKVYRGTYENGALKLNEVLSDTFDTYIQSMIKKGDILTAPLEDE